MRTKAYAQLFHCIQHELAVASNHCSVEDDSRCLDVLQFAAEVVIFECGIGWARMHRWRMEQRSAELGEAGWCGHGSVRLVLDFGRIYQCDLSVEDSRVEVEGRSTSCKYCRQLEAVVRDQSFRLL